VPHIPVPHATPPSNCMQVASATETTAPDVDWHDLECALPAHGQRSIMCLAASPGSDTFMTALLPAFDVCRGKGKHSDVTTYSQSKLYVILAVKVSLSKFPSQMLVTCMLHDVHPESHTRGVSSGQGM
jgi:hypothetical protein